MIKKYNNLEVGSLFKGRSSGKTYEIKSIRIYVYRGNYLLNLVKPKSRITTILREISMVMDGRVRRILLKRAENCKYPQNSRILKEGFNIVDNNGRLRVSWKESLYLMDNKKQGGN